jgi:hypothetical protein
MTAKIPRSAIPWATFERHKAECLRVTEHEVLQIVSRCEDGLARASDFLKYLYSEQSSEFIESQIRNAEWAFIRVAQKGLLEPLLLPVLTKKKGPAKFDRAWRLTNAGRHNLATHATGATARSILDEIEDEK